jgi:transcription elongation factor B subunit 2
VKRKKTTIFVHVEPTDTVLEVKQKLQELTQQAPDKQRLYKDKQLLEDARKLADLRIENDDVIAMTYLQDGQWEEIDIISPESAAEATTS